MKIIFNFNAAYREVFTTKCRYIDVWGGRGRGGSHFGTDYFLFLITQPRYFRGFFLRQTFNDIRTSLFADFKDRIREKPELDIDRDFTINDNMMQITCNATGNTILCKGAKRDSNRTAALKSLAGATHVLIEETDELGEDDFDDLDYSLRTIKVENIQVIRIFNPPHKSHWLWRNYTITDSTVPGYFRAAVKSDSGILSIFSTAMSNRKNIHPSTWAKFEETKARRPEYYYTMIRGLISEGMKGRVFSGWQTITDAAFNDVQAVTIFGQDFGTSAPAGFVMAKNVNNNWYFRELNYLPKTTKELAVMYCQLGITEKEIIIADSAEPFEIAKLRRGWTKTELTDDEISRYPMLLTGFNIYGAIKGPGSVTQGINLLKDSNVYVTESSVNLWAEYANYKWQLDKNKIPTDDPEDNNNHLIDPVRYVRQAKGARF